MDPDRWKRVEALFQTAIDLDGAEREAALDAGCGDDEALRRAVERLLFDEERSRDLVTRLGVMAADAEATEDHLVGRRVGRYRLEERLAAGGMGLVYRARRDDGVFEQQVAVKLIRAETATPAMRERFEFERRALGALQHPNIAKLFDGGTTEEGTPYLVMELIHGSPIDTWCEEHRLPLRERLRLFVRVCRAVHFAHQSLVLHRDLKPGNVMIDRDGTPKLLDFGIARLLDDADEIARARTVTVARVLTPEYASPEQLRGESLTTASDVYSLGIVLYGLVTGQMPFRSDSRSAAEWERLVTEREPTRPSTALAARARADDTAGERFAAACGSTLGRLSRELRGDLDRIVLVALRKEPARRYASAEQLAQDVERFLDGLPVSARDDSLSYRAVKFVGRNRIAVAAGLFVFLSLVAGIASTWRMSLVAREEAVHAEVEATSFQRIAEFLLDAFLVTGTISGDEERRRARETIDRQAARVRRQFAGSDHLRANLLDALGGVCLRLALPADAETLIEEAHEIRRREFGDRSLEVALSLSSLGRLRYQQRDFDAAEEVLTRALDLHRALPRGVHTDVATVANDLACVLRSKGESERAEVLHREALARRLVEQGEESLKVAESLNNLAYVLSDRHRYDEAVSMLRRAVAAREAMLGPDHALSLQTRHNLAITLSYLGATDEVERELRAVIDGYRNLRGAGAEGLARTMTSLASFYLVTDRLDEARATIDEALRLEVERLGEDHPALAKLRERRRMIVDRSAAVSEDPED